MKVGSIFLVFMWIVLFYSSCWINWEFIILAWLVSFGLVFTSWVRYISFSLLSRISKLVSNFSGYFFVEMPNLDLISSI